MIHSEQVQNTMQHKNTDFRFQGMAESLRLRAGPLNGDSQIAEGVLFAARERKDIGWIVVTKELAVEAAENRISRQEAIEDSTAGQLKTEAMLKRTHALAIES